MKGARWLAYALGTWFGCGRVPFAPGTAGTLAALPLYLVVRPLGAGAVALTGALVAALGVWATSVIVLHEGGRDPQHIVIDEVAGVLVTLVPAPRSWAWVAGAVVVFRVLDQTKPWPARTIERRAPPALGVVLDDLVAGLWGAGLVAIAARLAG